MSNIDQPIPLGVMDSETLGRYDDAIVLSVATTVADLRKRFSLLELVNNHTIFVKLDAKDQFERGRVKDPGTVAWWMDKKKVGDEARAVSLYPKPDDVKIDRLSELLVTGCHKLGYDPRSFDWCDRNMFDLRKCQHIMEITCGQYGSEPWHYHNTWDIVSWLKGVGVDRYAGIDARNYPGMVYHDPRHDAALDWLRIQNVYVTEFGLELIGD